MKKPNSGEQLAVDISARSGCSVQVGAALVDANGIFAWGWNSVGFDGHGLHAEAHAILRANKKRLAGATIYVSSTRRRNNKIVTSKPCEDCQKLLNKWNIKAIWRDNNGNWSEE